MIKHNKTNPIKQEIVYPSTKTGPQLWRFQPFLAGLLPAIGVGAAVYIVTGWITLPTLGLVGAPSHWWFRGGG